MNEQNGAKNNGQKETTKKLTAPQRRLMKIICNPEHAIKSITEICELANIARSSYYKIMDNDYFVARYDDEKEKLLKAAVIPIINTFVKEGKKGSYSHGLAILKMTGDFVEITKQQIEQQITADMKIQMKQEVRAEIEMEITGKGGGPIEIRSPRERIAARLKKLTGEDETKDTEE